jgi:hypothetical protein
MWHLVAAPILTIQEIRALANVIEFSIACEDGVVVKVSNV